LITAAFVSVREGESMTKLVRADAGAYLNMLALAPVAWLMAQMYVVAGWWAVLLFAVPLYTTRLAYSALWKSARCSRRPCAAWRRRWTSATRSPAATASASRRSPWTSGG
jgi:hypothetical protein